MGEYDVFVGACTSTNTKISLSNYFYFSSFSDTALESAKQNAGQLIRRMTLGKGSKVVEIASNDGYLLRNYVEQGILVLGIEPARNIAKVAVEKGVRTISEFFGQKLAQKLASEGDQADVIHANNVVDVLGRFLNMKVELYNFVSALNCILAQRLVRRICSGCAEDVETPPQMMIQVGFAPDEVKSLRIKRGRGCERCNNTGYKGRVGLFEVLLFTDEIRDMILSGASSIELKRKAIEEGMVSLRMSGLQKIREGATTLEEVLRETIL
jgi:uncharacterized pyridoxal phosphate-containing UPF0001 family protein